jgi:FKBP-type peptidyl-prolyl cis-trans isomerase SlyD
VAGDASICFPMRNRFKTNFNHSLVGETLHFDVKIASLRQATNEEMSHGHAHGKGTKH